MNQPSHKAWFTTTQWTVVLSAGHEEATEALDQLCRAYWYPVYAYIRRKGLSANDAQDAVQGFFLSLFQRQSLKNVAREKGRFHPEKTKIVDMGQPGAHFDYLGYRFLRSQRTGRLRRLIRPKSLKAIQSRIKPLTKRTNGQSLGETIAKLEPILRGVHGYFQHAMKRQLRGLDGWVRGRMRGILRKRHKGRGRGRGKDHQKWPNRYFEQLGLFSLEQARQAVVASLRKGVPC